MRMLSIRVIPVILPFLVIGCSKGFLVKNGRPFDPSYIGSIEEGKTTAKKIAEDLGSPQEEIVGSDGRKTWVYSYSIRGFWSNAGSPRVPVGGEFKALSINFDKDGIVKNYAYIGSDIEAFNWQRYQSIQGFGDVETYNNLDQLLERLDAEKRK